MSATKPVRIAFNMLCCATLFFWAKPWPRETISGLVGRKTAERRGAWTYLCWGIDWLHRKTEHAHCYGTAALESRARQVLGYHP